MVEGNKNRYKRRKNATLRSLMISAFVAIEDCYEKYLTLKLKIEDKLRLCDMTSRGNWIRKEEWRDNHWLQQAWIVRRSLQKTGSIQKVSALITW